MKENSLQCDKTDVSDLSSSQVQKLIISLLILSSDSQNCLSFTKLSINYNFIMAWFAVALVATLAVNFSLAVDIVLVSKDVTGPEPCAKICFGESQGRS